MNIVSAESLHAELALIPEILAETLRNRKKTEFNNTGIHGQTGLHGKRFFDIFLRI